MVDYRAQLRSLADLERKGAARRAGPAIQQAREDA
jgi:hypothetical protein